MTPFDEASIFNCLAHPFHSRQITRCYDMNGGSRKRLGHIFNREQQLRDYNNTARYGGQDEAA